MKSQVKQSSKRRRQYIIVAVYLMFLGLSWGIGFEPGKQISVNFYTFAVDMLKVLPVAFVLISLFEVWVKRKTVEKHFGEESGWKGYFWAIMLAGTIVGPLYIALPVAHSLQKKGAHLGPLFAYISASAICRIPMTTFEASFLGIKFTIIRFVVSLPLVVLSAMLLGNFLTKRQFCITDGMSAQ
ncbi:hypothetical protein CSA56_04500 [candidate division KSB3 bacterium]|uniref:Permease n=1 Tax=candidate division KSB3 bacterium TaxID=2044937 RepID=A0A2G6KJX5_9BACT|nr:MAG: hypothetical protein CSA56_04500 [candidate division KSB3 bacterium]